MQEIILAQNIENDNKDTIIKTYFFIFLGKNKDKKTRVYVNGLTFATGKQFKKFQSFIPTSLYIETTQNK